MKQSYTFKSDYFIVLSTEKDGTITRDSFYNRTGAELFRDEVLMKRDDIKRIEILELLSRTH
jgi:hypothetical protein